MAVLSIGIVFFIKIFTDYKTSKWIVVLSFLYLIVSLFLNKKK